jgi:hypothetical protein
MNIAGWDGRYQHKGKTRNDSRRGHRAPKYDLVVAMHPDEARIMLYSTPSSTAYRS